MPCVSEAFTTLTMRSRIDGRISLSRGVGIVSFSHNLLGDDIIIFFTSSCVRGQNADSSIGEVVSLSWGCNCSGLSMSLFLIFNILSTEKLLNSIARLFFDDVSSRGRSFLCP